MGNILQDGAVWLGEQLKQVAGVTVTYQRGSSSIAGLTATVYFHEYELADQDGFVTVVKSRDYILHAADLELAGSQITPRSGDRIIETINAVSHTFEVVPLGTLKEHEPLDTDGVLLKVHTKRIA